MYDSIGDVPASKYENVEKLFLKKRKFEWMLESVLLRHSRDDEPPEIQAMFGKTTIDDGNVHFCAQKLEQLIEILTDRIEDAITEIRIDDELPFIDLGFVLEVCERKREIHDANQVMNSSTKNQLDNKPKKFPLFWNKRGENNE